MAGTRSVVWSVRALDDLETAYGWFRERNPDYAARFLWEIEHSADSLAGSPERGHVVPELKIPVVRQLVVEKHRLIYRLESTRIVIARLLHGRQDFKSSWKSRT